MAYVSIKKSFLKIFIHVAANLCIHYNGLTLKMLDLYLLGQNCLHLTFKPYLSNETYSRKYEKLPDIVVHACKILQKNVFVENVWPANVALFASKQLNGLTTIDNLS